MGAAKMEKMENWWQYWEGGGIGRDGIERDDCNLNYFSFNMITFLSYLNQQLVTLRVYEYKGHGLNIKISADIKAFWQVT